MQHHKEVIAMTMQQIIQQFQDEVMEAHLRKLRAENEEYQEIERELLRLAHKVQEHMETLSDSQQKILMDYSDTRNSQESANYNCLYLAGMKDAVRILQYLEVL